MMQKEPNRPTAFGSCKYLGVYSQRASRQGRRRKICFFVWESKGSCFVQELDSAFVPVGQFVEIPLEKLRQEYRAEPGILAMPMSHPVLPEAPGRKGRLDQAGEKPPAVKSEADMRENFRLALLRTKRPRERSAAINELAQLATDRDGISPAHKFAFRDFCVSLRRSHLPEIALLFGRRVVELSPQDDHAHFNLARVLCLLQKYDEAIAHLQTAMALNGDELVYPRMLAYVVREKRHGHSRI